MIARTESQGVFQAMIIPPVAATAAISGQDHRIIFAGSGAPPECRRNPNTAPQIGESSAPPPFTNQG
jgi:hypothetical protein